MKSLTCYSYFLIVFEILLRLINGDSMQKALQEIIPVRKIGEHTKQDEEGDGELDDSAETEGKQITDLSKNSDVQGDQNDVAK